MRDPAPDRIVLRLERTFNASAQAVFDAWTSAEVGTQLVEVEFNEHADGTTTVVLTNRGLRDAESERSHRDGWLASFDNLERVLAK